MSEEVFAFNADIQQLIFQTIPGGGFASVVQNAGEATVQGIETEIFLRPAGSFEVRLAAGYTDAGYDVFLADLVGIDVIKQDDGAVNVFIGTGQALVIGAQTGE